MSMKIGFEVTLQVAYEQALEYVIAALKAEGFGVLTRIDVKATLKEKIGEDFRPYAILGACNPPLARRALLEDPTVGLMLPCNVTVEEKDEAQSIVRIANPETMLTMGDLTNNKTLQEVAKQARQHLERVAQSLLQI